MGHFGVGDNTCATPPIPDDLLPPPTTRTPNTIRSSVVAAHEPGIARQPHRLARCAEFGECYGGDFVNAINTISHLLDLEMQMRLDSTVSRAGPTARRIDIASHGSTALVAPCLNHSSNVGAEHKIGTK